MTNDGKDRSVSFTSEQVAWFKEFRVWDELREDIKESTYEDFIKQNGAGCAVNALHLYEIWKKQQKV